MQVAQAPLGRINPSTLNDARKQLPAVLFSHLRSWIFTADTIDGRDQANTRLAVVYARKRKTSDLTD